MRFPVVIQKDSMQCGVACLSMICEHFGKKYSLSFLEKFCFSTSEGVSLKGIGEAAGALGIETRGGLVTIESLERLPLPCVLHWNQNHFVVLYEISRKGRRYLISDPGKGHVSYDKSEFCDRWLVKQKDSNAKGAAMFFLPGEKFGKVEEDNSGDGRSMKFLVRYLLKYRAYFLQIIVGLLLGCMLQLIMPFLTQAIVDIGIKHQDIKIVWLILLGELMIVAGRTATDFIRRWLLLHISMRINISLVGDFFIKLLKLPMSFFDTKLIGDLLQRIGDHGRVQNFLTGQVLGVVFTILSFIVFGIVLLIYNSVIFIVFVSGCTVYGLWIASFLKKRKVLDYELFERQAINEDKTFQFITSAQEIKLQGCEQRRRCEWEDSQADLFDVQMKSLRLRQTQEAGSIFINEVKNIVITVLAATAVIDGKMTLGQMLAVQYIIGQLNSPVSQLMSFIYSLQDVRISLERINEIHNVRNEESENGKYSGWSGQRTLSMRDVNFKYDPHASKYTLSDVSFEIPQGKVTAIVGSSGSGKTTLIKIMLGYYKVSDGEVNIAGRNIMDYDLKWWRCQCGVVMQDGVIFSESIERNIAVSDGHVDSERLENAAKIACIHDFIMGLPLKYATKIGRNGMGLSQGQKQRILIARAVYKNPDYIFLDEATNALDAKNERSIVENLNAFYKGRTVVVVAHRLSTVRNADKIVVIDKGKIIEIGNHDTLVKKKGAYYNLVKNQLELGK